MNIQFCLNQAIIYLTPSETARLDSEILLAQVLNRSREYLYTHDDFLISETQQIQFNALLARRKQGEPIAYLTGRRAFWAFEVSVTPDVLVPRPETEVLVEVALSLGAVRGDYHALELGTGSGAIACALCKERPHWKITATDFSKAALTIAKQNAKQLQCEPILFLLHDWHQDWPFQSIDMIVSNPPYLSLAEHVAARPALLFEPKAALVAADDGRRDLNRIVQKARRALKPQGILILEHGYQQADFVRKSLQNEGYDAITTFRDLAHHERVTLGQCP